jgi:hypothetical protein
MGTIVSRSESAPDIPFTGDTPTRRRKRFMGAIINAPRMPQTTLERKEGDGLGTRSGCSVTLTHGRPSLTASAAPAEMSVATTTSASRQSARISG